MSGITGILLNWKRPHNIQRIISYWRECPLISEIIVWNNNSDRHMEQIDGVTIINTSSDLGLYTRFVAGCLAQNECLLIQDDDLIIPINSLELLYRAWRADPEIIHGIFGRAPKRNGNYAINLRGYAEVPIVLTRAMLAHRLYTARFFQISPQFSKLQLNGKPHGNGEDILFSYIVRQCSGRLNRVHPARVIELPAPHSISKRYAKAHRLHRTEIMHACEKWLNEESDKMKRS